MNQQELIGTLMSSPGESDSLFELFNSISSTHTNHQNEMDIIMAIDDQQMNPDEYRFMELLEQWKFLDSSLDFQLTALPNFLLYFLQGELQDHPVDIMEVTKWIANGKHEMDYGYIVVSFFLIEFCLKKLGTLEVIVEFYNKIQTEQVHKDFKNLIRSIVIQQLQEKILVIPLNVVIPPDIKSHLNYEIYFQKRLDGCIIADLTMIDNTFIEKVQDALIYIINKDYCTSVGINSQHKRDQIKSTEKMFGVTVISSIMQTYKEKTFRNVYETMTRLAVDTQMGNPQVRLRTLDPFGAIRDIRIHHYNAQQRGIPDHHFLQDIPTVRISASGFEINVLLDLVYTTKSALHFDGKISFAVYEMAKALKIPNIMNFLFGTNCILRYTVTGGSRIEILKICIKEKSERIFKAVPDLNLWLREEDKSNMLSGLTAEEVIWLLDRPQNPYNSENDVYCALVNWALTDNKLRGVVASDFQLYNQKPDVLASFNSVYEKCICFLNLKEYELKKMISDGFVAPTVIKAALDRLNNRKMIYYFPCVRKREDECTFFSLARE